MESEQHEISIFAGYLASILCEPGTQIEFSAKSEEYHDRSNQDDQEDRETSRYFRILSEEIIRFNKLKPNEPIFKTIPNRPGVFIIPCHSIVIALRTF